MTKPVIDDETTAAYRRDGAVCLRGAFDMAWIESLRAAVDANRAEPGPMARYNTPEGQPGEFFVDFQLWQRHDACRRFVTESPAAEIAAALLGARTISFYHDHLLVKEPGTLERTPWHHDQPYYPLEGEMVGSIWLPLDTVAEETCVEYIAGSHRWGRWFAPQYFNRANTSLEAQDPRFEPIPDFDAERRAHRMLRWSLEPGDCIFFHALTVHGAPGNRASDRRRRAYATRWLGEDARYASRPGRISPPLEGHGLQPGDAMTCEMFPEVWPRAA